MWVWKLSQRLALAARPDTPPLISDTESQVRSENGKWLSFNILSDLLMHWPSNSVRKELSKSENIFQPLLSKLVRRLSSFVAIFSVKSFS